ncbi:MAG TPA: response regulator [Pseudolabrys sp.]|nr:response regulator [Pseudolabrys sp.]
MRVLLIDDQPHVRLAVSIMLQAYHCQVVEAESGVVGLQKFKDTAIDLAIIDIYLPGMDGVKIIKALRGMSPNLPIIAMSGVSLNLSDRTALDYMSMLPYLSDIICLQKPFRPERLAEAIQKTMSAGGGAAAAS